MITNLTPCDLIDFEEDILQCFEDKKIRAPIHLAGGNESEIIDIFEGVKENDWVCCTWRSHYECLLKGVPPELVKEKILNGYSISLCFKDYKVISSAIVGGITPIAMGLAWAAKEKVTDEHVWCFIGDMSATTGIFYESWNYAMGHDLPITFVIADNGKSVCTPTLKAWGAEEHPMYAIDVFPHSKIKYYQYESVWPHAGGMTRVNF